MKTIEKMILCCIWICIAIVGVLIRDQIHLNEMMRNTEREWPNVVIPDLDADHQVLLDEVDVMAMVVERIPVMSEALLEFREDGMIEVSMKVNAEMIEAAKEMMNHDLVSTLLPLLEGTEVGCEAVLSAEQIDLLLCKAGFLSVPDELLSVVEEKLNKTWEGIVHSEGIKSVEVDESGLHVTINEE